MKNKPKCAVILLVFLLVYFYLTSLGFAIRLIEFYENYFFKEYCSEEYGDKKEKLIDQNIDFYKFTSVVYSQYIGDETVNKDMLINHSRLAVNEYEKGDKEQYLKFLGFVEKGVKLYFPKKSALEYIQEVKVFDESICSSKK